MAPEPRSASVTALEDGLLLRIDKVLLDELLADRPELASGGHRLARRMVCGTARRTWVERDDGLDPATGRCAG